MKNLFYRLLIYLDSANETDTNYNIAWYMAHHISEVAHMGISKLASECFVSPATISRFCRTLGYENYAHLKQECAWFSSTSRKFNNLINVLISNLLYLLQFYIIFFNSSSRFNFLSSNSLLCFFKSSSFLSNFIK